MKISIGNKRLNAKPETQQEKCQYFKDLEFKTVNVCAEKIKDIVDGGYTITYLFKDKVFDRSNHYMTDNYVGTQFICVDVDSCEIAPQEFVERIKYKPSVVHTTFSNLTERKNGKFCFHLLYFFDEVILGEDTFKEVFAALTDDYKEYVDDCARDCHRVMFTSNSSLPNYVYEEYGITYDVDDFVCSGYDDIDQLFKADNDVWEKSVSCDRSNTHNISRDAEISQENIFELDTVFMKDLYSLDRQSFIIKYAEVYPYVTQTQIDNNRYENGYADLRNEEYYVVPSAQYRWDYEKNTPHIPKIKEGVRTTILWLDTISFMKIIPNITKEYLVYLLITEVYKNFENRDGQMTNRFIIEKCREVWENIDKLDVRPVRKTFKIDKEYWINRGYNNWLEVARIVRKGMRCDEFGSLYDLSKTVEDNVREFRNYGVNTTKRTLVRWLEENEYPYDTDKDLRDRLVLKLYNEDPTRSSREIEKLCTDAGVKVSYRTVQTIISEFNSCV